MACKVEKQAENRLRELKGVETENPNKYRCAEQVAFVEFRLENYDKHFKNLIFFPLNLKASRLGANLMSYGKESHISSMPFK